MEFRLDEQIMDLLIQNAQDQNGISVDRSDLNLARRWINQMVRKGTDGIKITTGPEPDSWIVRVYGDFER